MEIESFTPRRDSRQPDLQGTLPPLPIPQKNWASKEGEEEAANDGKSLLLRLDGFSNLLQRLGHGAWRPAAGLTVVSRRTAEGSYAVALNSGGSTIQVRLGGGSS
ncbi:unnamed protein product [Urochloa humidicola]